MTIYLFLALIPACILLAGGLLAIAAAIRAGQTQGYRMTGEIREKALVLSDKDRVHK
jgi:hypothetical protein